MSGSVTKSGMTTSIIDLAEEIRALLGSRSVNIESVLEVGHERTKKPDQTPIDVAKGIPSRLMDIECIKALARDLHGAVKLNADAQRQAKRKADQGDQEAFYSLVLSYMPMVFRIAASEATYDDEFPDLVQEGTVGLMVALKRWNPNRVPLSRFGAVYIWQSISRYKAGAGSAVRVPYHLYESLERLRKSLDMGMTEGARPTEYEIAKALPPASLNGDLGPVLSTPLLQQFVDPRETSLPNDELLYEGLIDHQSAIERADEEDVRRRVRKWFGELDLSLRERAVLELRFGFGEGEPLTAGAIGESLHLSRQRVHQIEKRALNRIRKRPDLHTLKNVESTPIRDCEPHSADPALEVAIALRGMFKSCSRSAVNHTAQHLSDTALTEFWKRFFHLENLVAVLTAMQVMEIGRWLGQKSPAGQHTLGFMRRAAARAYLRLVIARHRDYSLSHVEYDDDAPTGSRIEPRNQANDRGGKLLSEERRLSLVRFVGQCSDRTQVDESVQRIDYQALMSFWRNQMTGSDLNSVLTRSQSRVIREVISQGAVPSTRELGFMRRATARAYEKLVFERYVSTHNPRQSLPAQVSSEPAANSMGESKRELRSVDCWLSIMRYGLMSSTYKLAMGFALGRLVSLEKRYVTRRELADVFLSIYDERLSNGMPQLSNPRATTAMEAIVGLRRLGRLSKEEAVERVSREAFRDVLKSFHTVKGKQTPIRFYEPERAGIMLTDYAYEVFRSPDKARIMEEMERLWHRLEMSFVRKRS